MRQPSIPNLFAREIEAERRYCLYFSRLMSMDRYDRIVTACRSIRRHAKSGPGIKAAYFTFHHEISALCELKQYTAAWNQLRRCERFFYGKRLDLNQTPEELAYGTGSVYTYIPLLFLLQRFKLGCALLENSLKYRISADRKTSFEFCWNVYSSVKEPDDRYCVSLWHFYCRLGKDLREWPLWNDFIDGFHHSLFSMTGLDPDSIRNNLKSFFLFCRRLRDIRSIRPEGEPSASNSFAEVRYESKIANSAEKVATQKKTQGRYSSRFDAQLWKYFPEIREEMARKW